MLWSNLFFTSENCIFLIYSTIYITLDLSNYTWSESILGKERHLYIIFIFKFCTLNKFQT